MASRDPFTTVELYLCAKLEDRHGGHWMVEANTDYCIRLVSDITREDHNGTIKVHYAQYRYMPHGAPNCWYFDYGSMTYDDRIRSFTDKATDDQYFEEFGRL